MGRRTTSERERYAWRSYAARVAAARRATNGRDATRYASDGAAWDAATYEWRTSQLTAAARLISAANPGATLADVWAWFATGVTPTGRAVTPGDDGAAGDAAGSDTDATGRGNPTGDAGAANTGNDGPTS
jgi:hypothetical protein